MLVDDRLIEVNGENVLEDASICEEVVEKSISQRNSAFNVHSALSLEVTEDRNGSL